MRKLAACARRTSTGNAVAPGCPPPPRSRVAKRAAASQASIPSPQALDDLPVGCCSPPRIPTTWGAKRARSAIGVPSLPVQPPPDPVPSASWRDWASLSDGPAGLIAERLLAAGDVADYVSFRAACRPWQLCLPDPREQGVLDRRFHPRQWTMLRTTRGSPYRRCFLNVTTGRCRYVHLPELRGHDVFGPTTEGLLVLLDRATCVVRLLNPFTRQAADLPPATALMTRSDLERRRRDGEDFAEISGAGLADDRTIAVYFPGITTLAVAKPGDAQWTVVDRGRYLSPAMSFAGRFYCATCRAVMVVEISDDQPPQLVVAAELIRPLSGIMLDTVHLVDNGGELTLVDRESCGTRSWPERYEVYQVDLAAGEMVPVRGLGGRAVFVGWERSLSVSPSVFPSISADTIYLGFDSLFEMDDSPSPVHLMDATSDRRRSKGDVPIICGRRGVDLDHCLSWCVTSYRRGYGSKDRC